MDTWQHRAEPTGAYDRGGGENHFEDLFVLGSGGVRRFDRGLQRRGLGIEGDQPGNSHQAACLAYEETFDTRNPSGHDFGEGCLVAERETPEQLAVLTLHVDPPHRIVLGPNRPCIVPRG